MPTIHHLGAYNIAMYFGDHPPPHFHVRGPDGEAKIAIQDGALIAGQVPRKILKEARVWLEANQDYLGELWQEFSE